MKNETNNNYKDENLNKKFTETKNEKILNYRDQN